MDRADLQCRVGANIGADLRLKKYLCVEKRTSFMRRLTLIELSPCVEVIVIEQRIEHEEVAPDRGPAINRVIRIEHDVTLAERDIDHHWTSRDIAAVQQA